MANNVPQETVASPQNLLRLPDLDQAKSAVEIA